MGPQTAKQHSSSANDLLERIDYILLKKAKRLLRALSGCHQVTSSGKEGGTKPPHETVPVQPKKLAVQSFRPVGGRMVRESPLRLEEMEGVMHAQSPAVKRGLAASGG